MGVRRLARWKCAASPKTVFVILAITIVIIFLETSMTGSRICALRNFGAIVVKKDFAVVPRLIQHEDVAFTNDSLSSEPRRGPIKPVRDWPEHIREACARNGVKENRGNFSVEALGGIVVDEIHKVMYCPIPKVACTTWVRTFLILNGNLKASEAFDIPSPVIHTKWKELKYLSQYPKHEALTMLDTYFKFIVVRDPYERLLSAYRNKLEQAKGPFHSAFNRPIIKRYRKGRKPIFMPSGNPDSASFREFIEYLSDSNRTIRMNNHWAHFHVLCHPCVLEYDYVGNVATMETDAEYFLKKIGRSKDIHIPGRRQMGYVHKKSESLVEKYFSTVPKEVLDKLNFEYRLDFEIFNFTVPKIDS